MLCLKPKGNGTATHCNLQCRLCTFMSSCSRITSCIINMVGESPAPAPALAPVVASYTLPGQLPEVQRLDAEGGGVDAAVVVVAVTAALAMSAVLLLAIYYLHILRKSCVKPVIQSVSQGSASHEHMLPATHVSSSSCTRVSPAQVFTFKQLQLATCNFSPANFIAAAHYSMIYRGVLPNGRLAAIKQLHYSIDHGRHVDQEFRMEVDLLSRLHSPYLLDLIGYCADLDHRLLVYEDMPNGSLQEQLHLHANCHGPGSSLDWSTRMQIAVDAARGLEYLHEFVSPPIIHRNFESSIVLLGENFSAKISEFGLAKLGSEKMNGQVFTRVLGTQGYVAPEYALRGQLTTKSDVYSFGIVLLELITGRTPVDMERPPGQAVLVSWALPQLTDRDKVHEMVDPALKGQYSNKELIQVAAIAAMCVQPEAEYRPLMTDVVQSLAPLGLMSKSKPKPKPKPKQAAQQRNN